jgi:hypothetical protein
MSVYKEALVYLRHSIVDINNKVVLTCLILAKQVMFFIVSILQNVFNCSYDLTQVYTTTILPSHYASLILVLLSLLLRKSGLCNE